MASSLETYFLFDVSLVIDRLVAVQTSMRNAECLLGALNDVVRFANRRSQAFRKSRPLEAKQERELAHPGTGQP